MKGSSLKRRLTTLATAAVVAGVPLAVSPAADAVSGKCSSQRIKVALSFQPDQAKARATCSSLGSDTKFKAILTSGVFPNAVSSWRSSVGSVETGTRPWAGSSGSDVQLAHR